MRSEFFNRLVQVLSIVALLAIVFLVYLFLKSLPPAPTNPKNIAYLFYLDKNYSQAVNSYRKIVKENPNDLEARYFFAMSLLKNQNKNEAEAEFSYLNATYPNTLDIEIGLAEAQLKNGHFQEAVSLLENLRKKYPKNEDVLFLLADGYYKTAQNLKAAYLYKEMIGQHIGTKLAKKRFLKLTGYPKYDPKLKIDFQEIPFKKPANLQLFFRTNRDYIEAKENEAWKAVYLKGVNLSLAEPGHFASDPPRKFGTYEAWLNKIAEMNCNVIRLYTLAAPAFYQALKLHNEKSEKKIWLFQEIWLPERDPIRQAEKEAFNLFDPSWAEEFSAEIQYVIDAVHGRGDIPIKQGRTGGLYFADVSQYVIGYGIGNELLPSIVVETNKKNSRQTFYQGRYITLLSGSATEVWCARMCDFAAGYETTTYNAQRPLTIINYPPLDPLYHLSESTFAEQNTWQARYNLPPSERSKLAIENDVAAIDIMKFRTTPLFNAGLFACYHAYPHWPDFMWTDPKYIQAKDREGHNPYYGYIVALKERHENFPLVMGEYGMSTSWLPVYLAVGSINEGGYSFQEQADWLVRNSENIFNAHYAGGLVFEFQDEWWQSSALLFPYSKLDEKQLWFNVLDGASCFGIQTFNSVPPTPLLRGDRRDWREAKLLSYRPAFKRQVPGNLKRVYATSDFAFFYIRVDIEPLTERQLKEKQYRIALSTLADRLGASQVPELNLQIESGFNFLIQLTGDRKGILLTEKQYQPFEWSEAPSIVGGKTLTMKTGLSQEILKKDDFEEFIVPVRHYRISRDGTVFPEMTINYSHLKYGTADPESKEFDNHASWHIDPTVGIIEIRIPWMLLFISPPSRSAMVNIAPVESGLHKQAFIFEEIPGIKVVAVAIDQQNNIDTLPKNNKGIIFSNDMPMYTWKKWNKTPPFEPRLKTSYHALQKLFNDL